MFCHGSVLSRLPNAPKIYHVTTNSKETSVSKSWNANTDRKYAIFIVSHLKDYNKCIK
jgi:hypothetical protein